MVCRVFTRFRNCLSILLIFGATADLWAEAYYATKLELIQMADVIAVVEISKVEPATVKGKGWTYQQVAVASVEQLLKGQVPPRVLLYGREDFICASCVFKPGHFLVFLRKNGDLLVGANWQSSLRPIYDNMVEWYTDNQSIDFKPLRLPNVLGEINTILYRKELKRP